MEDALDGVLSDTVGGTVSAAAGSAGLEHSGTAATMRVHSDDLDGHPAVVLASEPMDDDPGWRAMTSGRR